MNLSLILTVTRKLSYRINTFKNKSWADEYSNLLFYI